MISQDIKNKVIRELMKQGFSYEEANQLNDTYHSKQMSDDEVKLLEKIITDIQNIIEKSS